MPAGCDVVALDGLAALAVMDTQKDAARGEGGESRAASSVL